MTAILDTATARLVSQLQEAAAPDAELAAREHEARLVAQVQNATIAMCQRWILQSAAAIDRAALLFPPQHRNGLATAAHHYRSAANVLEALRT